MSGIDGSRRPIFLAIVVIEGREWAGDGVDVARSCREIRGRWPAASVVVLAEGATIEQLIDNLGSASKASRDASSERRATSRVPPVPPGAPRPGSPRLSDREWQIVELLGEGWCNKDIARELGISLATVKNHVHHILTKLGAERRGQIVARVHPLDPRPVDRDDRR
ncbi:MAG TPA: LuxR C-terminal-related transcriptional regulator [Gemmatimonadaceae bacterium]